MAVVVIDVSEDADDAVCVSNPRGFTLCACFDGVEIEMRHEQAQSLFAALRPWFEADDEATGVPDEQ